MPMGPMGSHINVPSWHSPTVQPLQASINALRQLCFHTFKGQQFPQLKESIMATPEYRAYKEASSTVGDYWCLKCKFWGHTAEYPGCPQASK